MMGLERNNPFVGPKSPERVKSITEGVTLFRLANSIYRFIHLNDGRIIKTIIRDKHV